MQIKSDGFWVLSSLFLHACAGAAIFFFTSFPFQKEREYSLEYLNSAAETKQKSIKNEIAPKSIEERPDSVVQTSAVASTPQNENHGNNLRASYLNRLRSRIEEEKVFPQREKLLKVQGRVVVGFTIEKSGDIKNVIIEQSSGHAGLDSAASKLILFIKKTEPIPAELLEESMKVSVPVVYDLL